MPLLSGDTLGDAACSSRSKSSPASRGRSTPPRWIGQFTTWLQKVRKPAGPSPKPKGPPILVPAGSGPKAAPTVAYVRPDPADHPRAKPKAAPLPDPFAADPRSEAFRQTEAELIQLPGGAALDDPIEDFQNFLRGKFSHLMCPIGMEVRSLAYANAPPLPGDRGFRSDL